MKTLSSIVAILSFFVFAAPAFASTITLSPSTISVTSGQTFTIAVAVDAGTQKVYTVKADVAYPADLLQVTSFDFAQGAPTWIPLSQTGYDQIENGTIIKTAGFPGGFLGTKALGTITFVALKGGTAAISVDSAAKAYDAASKDTLSGPQGAATVSVSPSAPIKATLAPTPTAKTETPAATQAPVRMHAAKAETIIVATSGAEAISTASASVLASSTSAAEVAAADGASENAWWAAIAAALALLAATAGWWFFLRKR